MPTPDHVARQPAPQLTGWVARLLFALWIADELWCARSRAEDSVAPMILPSVDTAILGALPLIAPRPIPPPVTWLGVALQLVGLVLMASGRRQLISVGSFGWGANSGTRPQTTGWYRRLEHPIYLGMIIHLLGWAAQHPATVGAAWALYTSNRARVVQERAHLAGLGVVHRGLDSPLWGAR